MCEKVKRLFDVNSDDQELRTMDYLVQVMEDFEKEHRNFALEGDFFEAQKRIAVWFASRYSED